MTAPEIAAQLAGETANASRFRHDMTPRAILAAAQHKGAFHVSREQRQDRLRAKAQKLVDLRLLAPQPVKRFGNGTHYTITDLGREVLREMRTMEKVE